MESILAIVCSGSSLFHSYPGIIASKLALEAYLNSPIELILLSRSHFLKVSRALKIQNMNLKETFHFGAINAFLPTPPPSSKAQGPSWKSKWKDWKTQKLGKIKKKVFST